MNVQINENARQKSKYDELRMKIRITYERKCNM